MAKVIAYIDGFNLYYGLRQAFGRQFLWLDLQKMCASLLIRDQQLVEVKYFTATARGKPATLRRQQTYWNALAASCDILTIERGRFQRRKLVCRACGGTSISYEEKETDVGIAVSLVEGAARKAFSTAILITADSDLCPAIRAVRRLHPAARLVAAFPPRRCSDELRSLVDASFTISRKKLTKAQLPPRVKLRDGSVVSRPPHWR